jgi:hypothetical protein
MVIHDRPGRLHSNSDQPTAITDVLVATLRAMQAYVAELLRVHQERTAPVRVAGVWPRRWRADDPRRRVDPAVQATCRRIPPTRMLATVRRLLDVLV